MIWLCFILILICAIYFYLSTQKPKQFIIRTPQDVSVHTVIARYNESVTWKDYMPSVHLYNKGAILKHAIPLDNVGREGHTYYSHIVSHYNKLPDYLICLQGNPFDHSPNLFLTIQHYFNQLHLESTPYLSLSEKVLTDDMKDGSVWHRNFHSWYYKLPDIPKEMPKKIYKSLFKTKMPSTVTYGTGAQFIVSKQAILKHPISFYQSIVSLLSTSSNPVEGFIIERFHGLIFT